METGPLAVPGEGPAGTDAYTPEQMARRVSRAGVADADRDLLATLALATIGGAMLGLAAAASSAALASPTGGYGSTRVIAGIVFGLGLTFVTVGGGELFTSNNLIAMAWASRKVRTLQLLRNWTLVYLGNLAGAASIAVLFVLGGGYRHGNAAVGGQALVIAATKSGRLLHEDVAMGVLGNALVCLAVWLCFSARTTTDRLLSCVLPMIALIVLGVDHVVANIHYFTAGLLLRGDAAAVAASGLSADALATIGPAGVAGNLVGVTIGNVIGGSVLVATVYWFVYLRDRRPADGGASAADEEALAGEDEDGAPRVS